MTEIVDGVSSRVSVTVVSIFALRAILERGENVGKETDFVLAVC
jgi:hypothetical protein